MPPLAAIERFFERLFERPSARLFHTRVQPVQIQRRIERAMDTGRRPSGQRTVVPNRFIVHLHPDDLAALADTADDLAAGLADEALSFARAHRYALFDRPRVDLLADPAVQHAEVRVDATLASELLPDPGTGSTRGADGVRSSGSSELVDPSATAVFTLPQPSAPPAVLHVVDPDGHTRQIAFETGRLTIGRADDNDVVARDVRVSRHHGRIVGRRGTLVYLDLGSTNGSTVNGEPVSEVVLGPGDRLEVGETTLVLEVAGAPE